MNTYVLRIYKISLWIFIFFIILFLLFILWVPITATAQTEEVNLVKKNIATISKETPRSPERNENSEYRDTNITASVGITCANLFQLILKSNDKCIPLWEAGYTGYSYRASCPGYEVPNCPLSY